MSLNKEPKSKYFFSQQKNLVYSSLPGALVGIMVSKLDKQTFTSEFESQWVPYSYGLELHQNKKLSELLLLPPIEGSEIQDNAQLTMDWFCVSPV